MGSYTVTRSITVGAPAHEVHALIDDFHSWTQWSPWESLARLEAVAEERR